MNIPNYKADTSNFFTHSQYAGLIYTPINLNLKWWNFDKKKWPERPVYSSPGQTECRPGLENWR